MWGYYHTPGSTSIPPPVTCSVSSGCQSREMDTLSLCPALAEARASLRTELIRHDTMLRGFAAEQRSADEMARRELDKELELILKSTGSTFDLAPAPQASVVGEPTALAAYAELTGVKLCRAQPDEAQAQPACPNEDGIFKSAALQLVEEKLELQKRTTHKTGYLRKASRQGRSSWRFQRVELRYDAGSFWFAYVAVPDADRDPSKPVRVCRKQAIINKTGLTNGGTKARRIRLLPGGKTTCAAEVDEREHKSVASPAILGVAKVASREAMKLSKKKASLDKQDSCSFYLEVDEHSSIWMASSPTERDEWVTAIRDASEMSSEPRKEEKPLPTIRYEPFQRQDGDHARSCVDAKPSVNIDEFLGAIKRLSQVSCRQEFVQALTSVKKANSQWLVFGDNDNTDADKGHSAPIRLCVPVPLARQHAQESAHEIAGSSGIGIQRSAPDGRRGKMGSASRTGSTEAHHQVPRWTESNNVTVSRLFNQMIKDMRRDRVVIDGENIRSEVGEHHEEVIKVLASRILTAACTPNSDNYRQSEVESNTRKVSCIAVGQQPATSLSKEEMLRISEAGALVHACSILIACTRTSSGGDAYACVQALCRSISDLVVVCPFSTQASPLEFSIRRKAISAEAAPHDLMPERHSASSSKERRSSSEPSSPSRLAARLFASLVPGASQPPEALAGYVASDYTYSMRASEPHRYQVEVQVHATAEYKICTQDPQDEPTDTWAIVKAVWVQAFSIFGEPNSSANLRAGDANVELTIYDGDV